MENGQTQVDKLREYLRKLEKERDLAIFEKGRAAQENQDLRENSAYDYWERKEWLLTVRIRNVTAEIYRLLKKPK